MRTLISALRVSLLSCCPVDGHLLIPSHRLSFRSHRRLRRVHEPGAGRRRGVQHEEQEPEDDGPDYAEGGQHYTDPERESCIIVERTVAVLLLVLSTIS